MQIWRSPWGDGNPGWHIECTAMSTKYLGNHFDIHGGGMDLKFPHHEDEIAQNCGALGCNPAKYWMHANMLNVNGQKMSKSFNNYFLPKEIIEGTTNVFEKPYPANVLRFCMMQAHYRSTLDLSSDSLNAAEKGFDRLSEAISKLDKLPIADSSSLDVKALVNSYYNAMDDDFNAPMLQAQLFESVKYINSISDGNATITVDDLSLLTTEMHSFVNDVLGLEMSSQQDDSKLDGVMDLVLNLRQQARTNKDWTTSDQIRDGLAAVGIVVKDGKDGTSWK
jgi:cysteinyl-tRNA synthetase